MKICQPKIFVKEWNGFKRGTCREDWRLEKVLQQKTGEKYGVLSQHAEYPASFSRIETSFVLDRKIHWKNQDHIVLFLD
jgi:hypothetical protein